MKITTTVTMTLRATYPWGEVERTAEVRVRGVYDARKVNDAAFKLAERLWPEAQAWEVSPAEPGTQIRRGE